MNNNQIVPIGQQIGAISEKMRQRMAVARQANRELSSNVMASYPLLSIRGKEFTFRLPDGRSARHEQNGFAMPYIDLVIVAGSPLLSKTYYAHGFDPSEFTRPDCWSLDSVKPDPSSPALQAGQTGPTCATCTMNVFGSKVTDAGKKIKACQDYRRVVVLVPNQVGSETATPMAMRVPQSSLKNLKAHAELLERYGVDYRAVISRLSFTNEAFPQLKFDYVTILTDQQYDWIEQLAASPLVQGMVHTPDFENAISTPEQQTPAHNEGLKPLTPAAPPEGLDKLMGEMPKALGDFDSIFGDMAKRGEPQKDPFKMATDAKAAPVHVQQASTLIELPDGRWFDPVTKQYVELPQEPVEEKKALDPATVELPDGRFYNPIRKAYVASLEIDAEIVPPPGAKPAAKPAARQRPSRAKPKPDAEAGALSGLVQAAEAQQPVEEVDEETGEITAPKPAGNGGVVPATTALDDLIRAAAGKDD